LVHYSQSSQYNAIVDLASSSSSNAAYANLWNGPAATQFNVDSQVLALYGLVNAAQVVFAGNEKGSASSNSSSDSPKDSSDSDQSSDTSKKGVSPGAVAGAVVGSLTLVAIVVGILLWRRQRRRNEKNGGHVALDVAHPFVAHPPSESSVTALTSSSYQQPQASPQPFRTEKARQVATAYSGSREPAMSEISVGGGTTESPAEVGTANSLSTSELVGILAQRLDRHQSGTQSFAPPPPAYTLGEQTGTPAASAERQTGGDWNRQGRK
jgi:hypothetical protein